MSGAGSGRDGQPSYKGGKSSKRKTQTTERQTIQLPPIIPTKLFKSHTSSLQINSSSSRQPNLDANRPQPHNNDVPPIILSQSLYSHTSPVHVNESPLLQPSLGVNQPQPPNIESQPQSNQSPPTNQEAEPLISPPDNRTPTPSSTIVDNVNEDHQIWIVPEEDG
ncbi:hypothetical protein KY290_017086 [Solanum tuberosum]|uniref:Uncharacterized protein n=2 Tax=Solanum tuberosum TaxID=4113 RepID=A0ABQ7VAC0_SOLTU|nr:hypothetical protein KY284_016152 [Solanum tuberosum]KAH0701867.1 hypothetical protein KY285_016145 [Solanum tuberosum]KAH0761013.1 hypothetical protein KY290_017086 [Solanum tuberosum]